MRITCPNCKATYEVGDADIPDEGIEVECSACLNRWMQMPNGEEAAAEIEAQAEVASAPSVPAPSAPEPVPEPVAVPEPIAPPVPEPESLRDVFAASAPEAEPETEPEPPEAAPDNAPEAAPWEEPVYDPAWETAQAPDLEGPTSEINAPTDLEPLDTATDPEPESAPTGWRVPKPPESAFLEQDPLDEILAEVNAAAEEVKPSAPDAPVAASAPEETGAEEDEAPEPSAPFGEDVPFAAPDAPEVLPEPETEPAAEAEMPDEPAPMPEPEPEPMPEPEPAPEPEPEPQAPHWSEVAATLAPVVAVAAAVATKAETPQQADDATKDLEDFIRDRVEKAAAPTPTAAPEAPMESASTSEEEEVFHPWDGEVAADIDGEPKPEAAEDDFEWDEPPDADTPLTFNPEPDDEDPLIEAHMAAIERQNKAELPPEIPEASNVIQADIPQAPMATMPSGNVRKLGAKPSKPTPVDSAEDVQAAIRQQITTMKKLPVRSVNEPDPAAKSGIFAKLTKAKPAAEAKAQKQEPVNKLKNALADFGEDAAPRKGKRTGFLLVMILFMLALVTYMFGDRISAMVPALEPYITGYSGMVDGLREATQKLIE